MRIILQQSIFKIFTKEFVNFCKCLQLKTRKLLIKWRWLRKKQDKICDFKFKMNFVFNQFIKDKFIIVNHSLNLLFFWTFFHCVQCTVCCFLWTVIIHYFRFYIHVFRRVNNFFRNIIIHATFCFVIFVCECYSLLFIKCKFRTIALFTS